ncbi:MAG: MFS transporter [Planctomycetaceae bacterium]|nr:MFS transporter [Planctomycetaceae bacterium]
MNKPSASPASRGSLFAVFLTVFIDLLGFGMLIPLVGLYARELVEDPERQGLIVGLLFASFSGMQFLFSPFWGRLSDRIGRRPVLLVGLAGSTVFYAIFGYATASSSLTWMFISRIGAGIAGATISTAQAYIADTTTAENRTKGMALIGAAFGLGFTFGPLLAAVALIPGETKLSPWPGYLASLLSGSAFLFAFFKLPESRTKESEDTNRKLFDFGAFGIALSYPSVAALLLTSFVAVLSFTNFEAVLPFLFESEPSKGGFGYSLQQVVLFFALVGFIHAMAQGGVRKMSARLSEAKLASGGAIFSLLGFFMMIFGVQQHSLGLVITGMLVIASGFAFIPAPLQSLISRRCDPTHQGAILGLGQSLGAMARIIGHALCLKLFEQTPTTPFWFGVSLMGLAIVLITINANRGKDYESPTGNSESTPATASAE